MCTFAKSFQSGLQDKSLEQLMQVDTDSQEGSQERLNTKQIILHPLKKGKKPIPKHSRCQSMRHSQMPFFKSTDQKIMIIHKQRKVLKEYSIKKRKDKKQLLREIEERKAA